jgi:hypothetical protein
MDELLEKLSDLEHIQWMSWTKYFLENNTPMNRARWRRQINTPYSELSEKEKESDREWARKVLELINSNEIVIAGNGEKSPSQKEEKFYCKDCNEEVKFGDKFCSNCGKQQLWALFG